MLRSISIILLIIYNIATMSQIEVAVFGATVKEDTATVSAGITADFAITSSPSITNLSGINQGDNGFYKGTINIAITNTVQGTYQQTVPIVVGTITGSSTKWEADGNLVVRDTDGGSATVNVTNQSSPFDNKDITVGFEIDDPGQTKIVTE